MRSVRSKILLWCFGTLVLSLVAFVATSIWVSTQNAGPGMFQRVNALLLETAMEGYVAGGLPRLQVILDRMDRDLTGHHYLVDSKGRDVLTGADRAALLAIAGPGPPRKGQMVLAPKTADGRYALIVAYAPPPFELRRYLPYYLLILAAIALLCWILAVQIGSPLKTLAQAVDRFGAGDLSIRVHSKRKDEIGGVSRAFDRMAERIGTLLTSERRLLQDISHELRTPLARLSFAAELARTAQDREAAVARMKKEIDRLTDLVGALLQVTRAESDPLAATPENVRLDEVLDEVVEDCRVEADARGCRIELKAGSGPVMRGHRELLRRAIENVVRNSIRYTPGGSAVEVSLDTSKDAARISVRDYGPGVPDEVLPRIFQPFFRVDDSRDSATGGMGLGLAIARRAIGLHHGQLWAQNAKPGLMVWIELPLAA